MSGTEQAAPARLPSAIEVARAPRRSYHRGGRVLLVLAAALLLCMLASVAVGAKSISPVDVWTALTDPGDTENDVIVRTLRIPRTVLGVMVGAALGMAGALMQGHTRNPLADPGLLGVEAGAAFAVVLAIYVLGFTATIQFIWFAFAGALAASVVVFLLGSIGKGAATPVTLALAGAAISALLGSFTSALVLMDRQTLDVFRLWEVGALTGRPNQIIIEVAPFLVLGVLLALINGPALNTLSLGEDVARGLGQSVLRTRVIGIAAITLLAGGSVAAAGPIAFVGLVVPHVARALVGPDYRWLLPTSALAGAVLVVAADVIGRLVIRPGEMQVGIIMALIGAPFFIWLVRRRRLAAL
ncbi:MAG: FecCD family ABC transporter permease [Sporichthyaceae bacterium]